MNLTTFIEHDKNGSRNRNFLWGFGLSGRKFFYSIGPSLQPDKHQKQSPNLWQNQLDGLLGSYYPLISAIGNHDEKQWVRYQSSIYQRYEHSGLSLSCYGEVGKNTICTYKGVAIVSSAQGTPKQDPKFVDFVDLSFSTYPQFRWRICSFHKNMKNFQIGGKGDDTGYEIYDMCRQKGAIITTGHEHSYSRTKTMTNYAQQEYIDSLDPNEIELTEGSNVAWVSGVSGQEVRSSSSKLRAKGWWATALAANTKPALQSAAVLFCKFNFNGDANLAYCYLKQINGVIRDEFYIHNMLPTPPPTPAPTPLPTPSPIPSPTIGPLPTSSPTPSTVPTITDTGNDQQSSQRSGATAAIVVVVIIGIFSILACVVIWFFVSRKGKFLLSNLA